MISKCKLFFTLFIPIYFLCFSPLTTNESKASSSTSRHEPINTRARAVNSSTVSSNSSNTYQLNKTEKELLIGNSFKLTVNKIPNNYTLHFSSSNNKIATVTKQGKVTAKNIGKTTITVIIKQGTKKISSLSCKVVVGPPAYSIVLSKKQYTLPVSTKTHLKVVIKPFNSTEIPTFKSSNTKILTINKDGLIYAKAKGKAKVTAVLKNGKKATCTITVK